MFNFKLPIVKKLEEANEKLTAQIKEKDLEIVEKSIQLTRIKKELKWMRKNPPKFKIDDVVGQFKIVDFDAEANPEYFNPIIRNASIALEGCFNFKSNKEKAEFKELIKTPFLEIPPEFCWVYEIKPIEGYNPTQKIKVPELELLKNNPN